MSQLTLSRTLLSQSSLYNPSFKKSDEPLLKGMNSFTDDKVSILSSYGITSLGNIHGIPRKTSCLKPFIYRLQNPKKNPLTCEEIEIFLKEITKASFEDEPSLGEISKLIDLLILYARKGVQNPTDQAILEKDIQNLLTVKDEQTSTDDCYSKVVFPKELVCSSKLKRWTKTKATHIKNFCKSHKKLLIIGAATIAGIGVATLATVAAVNTVAGAALAESLASGAAAATAGAIAASQELQEENENIKNNRRAKVIESSSGANDNSYSNDYTDPHLKDRMDPLKACHNRMNVDSDSNQPVEHAFERDLANLLKVENVVIPNLRNDIFNHLLQCDLIQTSSETYASLIKQLDVNSSASNQVELPSPQFFKNKIDNLRNIDILNPINSKTFSDIYSETIIQSLNTVNVPPDVPAYLKEKVLNLEGNKTVGALASNQTMEELLYKLKELPNFDEILGRAPIVMGPDGFPEVDDTFYYQPTQVILCGEKKCKYGLSMLMNGIMTTLPGIERDGYAVSEMQGGNQIKVIYNPTLGLPKDLIKNKMVEKKYLLPVGKLLKEQIMDYFQHAEPDQLLHIDVHSGGGKVLKMILPAIPYEYRMRMIVDTYGTAGYIDREMVKRVRNVWHPKDLISKMADLKGWRKAKEEGTLVVLEDDGKSVLEAHRLMGGYKDKLRQNNEAFAQGDFK